MDWKRGFVLVNCFVDLQIDNNYISNEKGIVSQVLLNQRNNRERKIFHVAGYEKNRFAFGNIA